MYVFLVLNLSLAEATWNLSQNFTRTLQHKLDNLCCGSCNFHFGNGVDWISSNFPLILIFTMKYIMRLVFFFNIFGLLPKRVWARRKWLHLLKRITLSWITNNTDTCSGCVCEHATSHNTAAHTVSSCPSVNGVVVLQLSLYFSYTAQNSWPHNCIIVGFFHCLCANVNLWSTEAI